MAQQYREGQGSLVTGYRPPHLWLYTDRRRKGITGVYLNNIMTCHARRPPLGPTGEVHLPAYEGKREG
jgi:hypothetical protein